MTIHSKWGCHRKEYKKPVASHLAWSDSSCGWFEFPTLLLFFQSKRFLKAGVTRRAFHFYLWSLFCFGCCLKRIEYKKSEREREKKRRMCWISLFVSVAEYRVVVVAAAAAQIPPTEKSMVVSRLPNGTDKSTWQLSRPPKDNERGLGCRQVND